MSRNDFLAPSPIHEKRLPDDALIPQPTVSLHMGLEPARYRAENERATKIPQQLGLRDDCEHRRDTQNIKQWDRYKR